MTATVAAGPPWRSGRIAVVALALGIAAILTGYFFTLPEPWLRAFGADIALRAAADPDPPWAEDARQQTPRGLADNPYICLANLVSKPWDTMVVLPSKAKVDEQPVLAAADWGGADRNSTESLLGQDERYQLIVLLKDNRVVDRQLFYTFWGDLSALTRDDGFSPDTAIFTARSSRGAYVIEPADGVSPSACPPKS